nr:NFACT RNA binding domain-containing protein [uncultured Caproiciproducens sp.]
MALDGAFLRHIKREIEDSAIGAKVDKVYQPNREEMVLSLRTHRETLKLLMSARANSARIHFTNIVPENPKAPPMLCMLLRKKLAGARLVAVRQPGLERMLCLDFDAVNELGDEIRLTLVMEIMGRYSNIIFVDEEGKIIDALKRVDAEMSSQRLVLPGLTYQLPPPQNKLCLLTDSVQDIAEKIRLIPSDMELSKALLNTLQGVSPIVCRELEHLTGHGSDVTIQTMTAQQSERLHFFLNRMTDTVKNIEGKPFVVVSPTQKPMDFTFVNIEQYGFTAVIKSYDDFSGLLDAFYDERDRIDRMRVRSQDLLRILSTTSDRLSRKVNLQRAELVHCAERDSMRICGDLINANLYNIQKGASSAELQNFYDEALSLIKVKLNPAFSASQNAQKYYKEYRKARTAEEMLTVQIQQAQQELSYIDTVFEELSRAVTERDLSEIRAELVDQGYIRAPKGRQKQPASMGPLEFVSTDGFQILVGRNNRQNDQLTMKQANNNDIWLHTKNIPGSHTIILTQGRAPTETAIYEAAMLAAFHSRGRDSSKVPVDFTEVRNVSKPQGAKPGMVIYVNNKTVYVTPDAAFTESRKSI